jgi:hypothetical protein
MRGSGKTTSKVTTSYQTGEQLSFTCFVFPTFPARCTYGIRLILRKGNREKITKQYGSDKPVSSAAGKLRPSKENQILYLSL